MKSHLPVNIYRENFFQNFSVVQKLVEKCIIRSPGLAVVTQAYYPVCVHGRIFVVRVWEFPDFCENQVRHVQMVQLNRQTKQKQNNNN